MACSAWKLGEKRSLSVFGALNHVNDRDHHSRSLLSSEALEQNLGILVDPQVVHGLGVGRGGLKVGPALLASDISDGRKGVTAEGLHGCEGNRRGMGEERRECVVKIEV